MRVKSEESEVRSKDSRRAARTAGHTALPYRSHDEVSSRAGAAASSSGQPSAGIGVATRVLSCSTGCGSTRVPALATLREGRSQAGSASS